MSTIDTFGMPDDYVPLGRATFDEFSVKALEGTLRSVPTKDRRDIKALIFVVSQNTHNSYKESLAARLGMTTDMHFGKSNNPSYAGIPVEVSEEIPDGMIEIYGPLTPKNILMVT